MDILYEENHFRPVPRQRGVNCLSYVAKSLSDLFSFTVIKAHNLFISLSLWGKLELSNVY